ncbi:MAG: DNA alkylation repair protein [bacterium]
MTKLNFLIKELRSKKDKRKAVILQRFFKTGKGEYGEGDLFLGLPVPVSRAIAKKYYDLSLFDVEKLLQSKIHEERFVALLILIYQFQKGDIRIKEDIYCLYIRKKEYVNNWDLVDVSADKIVGWYLFDKDKEFLYTLAKSESVWDRRIAIMATFWFVKNGIFNTTFAIVDILFQDEHDLIHKAVGWMLREVGNRSRLDEEEFLQKHYKEMPRTMLRYAIEKFPDGIRQAYLKGII